MKSMNKTYKIQLPRNKEVQNIKTNIKDGTIEVEVELNEKWEPRDGEICFAMTSSGMWKFILIYGKSDRPCIYNVDHSGWVLDYKTNWDYSIIRPATDSEKQLLFDALAKKGKMWDAEKKAVVDLPKPQVEVKEHSTSSEKDINWEERRYEIARQIMDSQLSCCGYERSMIEQSVKFSVECADALIAELKKGGKK